MQPSNALQQFLNCPFAVVDPGDAKTQDIDRDRLYLPVRTAAAETRLLRGPHKAGLFAAVGMTVDGGNATVTVYDSAGNSTGTIVLESAADWALLYSIEESLGVYDWRFLAGDVYTTTVPTAKTLNSAELDITSADITTAAIAAITGGDAVTAEHGAGAIGTGVVPRTYRYTRDGTIITEIQVDLTGLAVKGDAAKDAIGLAAGGACYIGRYVVATCGVVYRVEMTCLEAPGEGTATITADIDLGAEDVGTTAYDGAVDDVVVNTGGIAAGCTYVNDVPALTANDYLYLVEGDTAATTGVYNAGQVIVRLYGHALLA